MSSDKVDDVCVLVAKRSGSLRPERLLLALVTAVAVTLLMAACSSGSGGTSSTASVTGGQQNAGSKQPVKVGVICSCSGAVGATLAPIGDVANAWSKSLGAAGGIDGRPVQLIFKDDASNPGTSVTAAQALIADHVAAVIDISGFSTAWSKPMANAGIPVIGGLIASAPYYQDPNFYPSGQTDNSAATATVRTAKAAGATNFGQFYCAEVPACKANLGTNKAAGKRLGVPLVYSASVSATAPNYTAQCVAAKQAHVAALFIGAAPTVVAKIAQDCTRQDYEPIYLIQGGTFTNQLASVRGLKDHLWMPFSIEPYFASGPEVQEMNAAVDKYYPGLRSDPEKWNGLAPQAWTAGLLIEKSVAAAGTGSGGAVTSRQLTKGLNSLKNETLDGWSPPLTFVAGQAHSVDCWFTARVENGKPKLLNQGKYTCDSGG